MLTRTHLLLLVLVAVTMTVNAYPKYPWQNKVCKDVYSNCHYWYLKKPNFCAIYGPSICKKYCGYCDTCKDKPGKTYFCRIYQRKGKCRTDYANRNCRRTCQKCTD